MSFDSLRSAPWSLKKLDFAVADLRWGRLRRSHLTDCFSLRTKPNRNAFDTLRVAEIGRQEVEADRDRTLQASCWRTPDYAKAVERSALEFNSGLAGILSTTDLARFDILNSLQPTTSLMRLISTTTFLPELPATSGFCSLLLVFERDSYESSIPHRSGSRLVLSIDNIQSIRLAFVQVCDRNFV